MGQVLRKVEEYKDESMFYIDEMYRNAKGWITRAEINQGSFKQWHYKVNELVEMDYAQENIYLSQNTFYKPCRRIENIKELNCNYIDLDTYNTEFTKDQILMNLNDNYFGKRIPTPNFIIDSGRGLYLQWLIRPVPYMALPLWKAVEEYLYKELKEFGADRKALDPTRLLRPPGSINSKSKTVVKIIEVNNYIHDLREIQTEYLPEIPKKEKNKSSAPKKKGRPKKVVYMFNERSLYLARIKDIVKICELRNYDLEGEREIILFLYRYYLNYFFEDGQKALEDTLELNMMFAKPLAEKEVTKATESAERAYKSKTKDYKYKNETLIELLQITEEEQKHMTTIMSKCEVKRRDRVYQKEKYYKQLEKEGKKTEKDKIAERRAKIKDLLAEGLLQKDICRLLNISKRNCIRDIKHLKEQGLI